MMLATQSETADLCPAGQAATAFRACGSVTCTRLVHPPAVDFLYRYALKASKWGAMRRDDRQAPLTPSIHGDPVMESLLQALLSRIEEASGERLHPTYSYFRVYKRGDVLLRHTDRPACEVSVTLSLGFKPEDQPWPICLERDGVPLSVPLQPGDALLYKGVETPHWRERFEGEQAAQVFLHYVRRDGPYHEWIYDKRPRTAAVPVLCRLIERLEGLPLSPLLEESTGIAPEKGEQETMPLDFSTSFTPAPPVVVQEVGDESVVMNAETRACLSLGPVATRIWTLLGQSPTLDAALKSLMNEYDASEERLRGDLERFVEKLLQHGLVVPRPAEQ